MSALGFKGFLSGPGNGQVKNAEVLVGKGGVSRYRVPRVEK